MRALEALRHIVKSLEEAGVADGKREARAILKEGLNLDAVTLFRDNPELSPRQSKRLEEILRRRKTREPLQYIIGHVEFCGLKIAVGPGVLIPRPETEIMVREALRRLPPKGGLKILDLCTGSGAIALAVARGLPGAGVYATDVSAEALSYARKNLKALGVTNVRLLEGDLFEPVKDISFDAILSNPPYIKTKVLEGLEPEIRQWEPREALAAGEDGLFFIRRIISEAPGRLSAGGILLIEIAGGTDAGLLRGLASQAGLEEVEVLKDYAGLERVFFAVKKAKPSKKTSGNEKPKRQKTPPRLRARP